MKGGRPRLYGFEQQEGYRCGDPACTSCRLFDPIPEQGTSDYTAWLAGIRTLIAADPLLLCRPTLWATVTKHWSDTDANH